MDIPLATPRSLGEPLPRVRCYAAGALDPVGPAHASIAANAAALWSEPGEEANLRSLEEIRRLTERIRNREAEASAELYGMLFQGIQWSFARQLPPDRIYDALHNVWVITVETIRQGILRDPERLVGFIRTVAKRQICLYIKQAVKDRGPIGAEVPSMLGNPARQYEQRQKIALMRRILEELSPRERDILTRFYLREQTQAQICQDLNLSVTQFRLLKNRAKARFGELGRRKLRTPLMPLGKPCGVIPS